MALNIRFEVEPFEFEDELGEAWETGPGPAAAPVAGSCPDVPVPPSKRPRLLVRGSVHSAVREVQRKLNAFHAYQVAAGLPGLRDAPLVEDCVFGKHTFAAVKSFQELVFPGMPVEHDGKVGPHTWGQVDAIALGPGPGRVAQLTVEQLRVTDDGFAVLLNWNQVIGLDTAALNVELIASGLPPATMPSLIGVDLSSRLPNRSRGTATLGASARFEAPRFRPDPANPNRIVYRLSLPLNRFGDFLKVERSLKEMATIVRNGGTSDTEFRTALGWNLRGTATQPVVVGPLRDRNPAKSVLVRQMMESKNREFRQSATTYSCMHGTTPRCSGSISHRVLLRFHHLVAQYSNTEYVNLP